MTDMSVRTRPSIASMSLRPGTIAPALRSPTLDRSSHDPRLADRSREVGRLGHLARVARAGVGQRLVAVEVDRTRVEVAHVPVAGGVRSSFVV